MARMGARGLREFGLPAGIAASAKRRSARCRTLTLHHDPARRDTALSRLFRDWSAGREPSLQGVLSADPVMPRRVCVGGRARAVSPLLRDVVSGALVLSGVFLCEHYPSRRRSTNEENPHRDDTGVVATPPREGTFATGCSVSPGISHSTVCRTLQRAETAGLSWQQAAGMADSALHAALHPVRAFRTGAWSRTGTRLTGSSPGNGSGVK